MDDSNQDTYSLTQLSKQIAEVSARGEVETTLRESKDASLESAIEDTNSLVRLNSEAITKESVERINADTQIHGRISDLSDTQITDKAYLVGEIERHHNEIDGQLQQVQENMNVVNHTQQLAMDTLSDQVDEVHAAIDTAVMPIQTMVEAHEAALDNTRWDEDWTLDSDYTFDWSIISEAQEWQLHIGEYTSKLEKYVNNKVDTLNAQVQDAIADAAEALQNSSSDTVLDLIQGSISFETLDKDLQDQFEKFKEDLYTERDERIQSTLNEAQALRNEILANTRDHHNALLTEAANRADDVSAEQQKRLEMYEQLSTESIDRLTAEADRIVQLIEDQAAETEAALHAKVAELLDKITADTARTEAALNAKAAELLNKIVADTAETEAALNAKATELLEAIVIESDTLKKDYTSKVEAINGDIATKASELTTDYTAKVNGLRTEVDNNLADVANGLQQSVDQLKTADGQIITSLNSYKVSNGKDIAAIQKNITVLNGAQESTATDLDALTVSFTGLDSEVKTNAADILTEKSARTSADGALSTRIDTLSASTANEFAATRASVDGVSNAVTDLDSATATKFDTVTASLKATDTKAGSAASAAAAAQKTADSAVTANSAQASDINSLKSRMTKTEGDVTKKANTTALDALTTTVEGQGAELAVHANSLTSLEAEIDVVDAKTDTAINNAAAAQKTADSAVTANTSQAADITTLKARMGTAEGNVAKKADASALSALETKVKDGDSALSTRVDILSAAITDLGESAETAVDVAAFNILKAEVENTQGVVSGHTTDLTELKGQLTVVQSDVADQEKTITAHGNSITTTENKVTAIEGTVTSQGSSITNLKSGLATTDSNVTAARNAANAANTLAGGKGKVLYQSTAPAAADRLPQNLWIDTTSGANTPKRWNGSAWASVTDKVATDAANAAANALKVANTKADATAFNALDTKVTTIEGNVTSHGTSITKLTNDLATTNTNVAKKADTTALTALDTKVTAVDGKVATNASALTTLQGRATTIEGNVAKKADTSALNNYYTKTQADDKATTLAAGQITSFSAKLTNVAGKNLFDFDAWNKATKVMSSSVPSAPVQLLPKTKYTISTNIAKNANGFDVFAVLPGAVASSTVNGTAVNAPHTFTTDSTGIINVAMRSNTLDASFSKWIQIELGDKATAFVPHVNNVKAVMDLSDAANADAINTTNAEVTRIDGVVKSEASKVSKLQSDLTAVDTKAGTAIKNAATAQQTANTAVTGNASTASSLNQLKSAYDANVIDVNGKITAAGNKAASDLTSAQTTLANADKALGTRIDNLTITVTNNNTAVKGQIKTVSDSVTTLSGSVNTRVDTLTASIKSANASSGDLIANPTFDPAYNQMGFTVVSTAATGVPAGCPFQYAAKISNRDHTPKINGIPCKQGDVFEMSALIACGGGVVDFNLYVYKMTSPTSSVSALSSGANTKAAANAGKWQRVTWRWTVSASCNFFKPFLQINQNSPFSTVWYVTDWHCVNVTAAAQAKATADANATAIDVTNAEVRRVNGEVVSQATKISNLETNLATTDTKAGNAVTAAAKAQSTANSGVTKADAAASTVNTLKTQYEAKVAHLDAADSANTSAITKTNTDLTNAQTALSNADKALGSRIDSLTTTVSNNDTAVKGQIKSVSDSVTTLTGTVNTKIDKLTADLVTANTDIVAAKKAAATAQSTANTAVTKANANTTALDKLSADFEVSARAANNLLINSNVEITYKGNGAYPHGEYALTEAWEVGAKYTLLWCASHKRAAGDTTSSLAVYMGGGLQSAQSFSSVENRIGKVTFTKTAQGLGKGISFYLLNKPANGVMTTATIYWAVLVKGDVLTTDQWIPSAQDYTADLAKTNAAIDGVKTAYAAADTALGQRIDTTNASITTAKSEIAADIKDVSKSVTDLKSANASKFSSIDASFKNLTTDVNKKIADTNAAITSTQNTLANADAAMADKVSKLTARVGTVETGKVNTSTLTNYYTKAQADSATAGKVEEFRSSLQTQITSNATAIKNTYTKAQTDSAITTKTNALKAQVDQNLATQNSTIKTWVDRNKVEAAMMETLAAELVPHMAGNTELFEDMEVNVGYEGVITALATQDAATIARLDKFDSKYATDQAAISAQFADTLDVITNKESALTKKITDLSATFETTVTNTLQPKLDTLSADIKQNYMTIANANSAIASANTKLKSEVTTGYTNAINAIQLDSITIPDTRNANQLPPWYRTNYKARMVNEFKAVTTIGLTSTQMGQTYCMLTTYVYYGDASGGPIKQVAIGKTDDQTFIRYSSGSGTSEVWGAWVKVNAKLEASISETTETINGVKAVKTVTINNNGVLSGYGLISELVGGKVTSAFGVDADNFYVGSPATGKKVFAVSGGVTYINDAVIPNLSASKITTGTLNAARIGAGSITTDKLKVTSLDALTGTIGVLRTKTTGARTEIKDNLIEIYDEDNLVRIQIGVLP